jgi:hypothetical protein
MNVMTTGKASFGLIDDLSEESEDFSRQILNAFISQSQYRHELEEYENEPITTMAFPVFDTFSPTTREVTGILCTAIYWHVLLSNVLSPRAQGIIAVLENSLGQVETYRLDGPEATYLGSGDRHDPAYDHMELSTDVTDFFNSRASPVTRSYTAVDLNDDYIHYELHLYPSKATEEKYVNNEPAIYASVVAAVFLFTALVFKMYDWLVEKRQTKVLKKAVQSTTLVKSTFPEAVLSRMYEAADESIKRKSEDTKNGWRVSEDSVTQVPESPSLAPSDVKSTDNPSLRAARPIADLYPECTVFFADIDGFVSTATHRCLDFGLLSGIALTKLHPPLRV